MLGNSVGDFVVGLLVGLALGDFVGGTVEGCKVGPMLGDKDGDIVVGAGVIGAFVGDDVGGAVVGTAVGVAVTGDFEGIVMMGLVMGVNGVGAVGIAGAIGPSGIGTGAALGGDDELGVGGVLGLLGATIGTEGVVRAGGNPGAIGADDLGATVAPGTKTGALMGVDGAISVDGALIGNRVICELLESKTVSKKCSIPLQATFSVSTTFASSNLTGSKVTATVLFERSVSYSPAFKFSNEKEPSSM
jgi:hypothetical protein